MTLRVQVAIALGGDVIYFELDPMGQLLEAEKKEVSCFFFFAFRSSTVLGATADDD